MSNTSAGLIHFIIPRKMWYHIFLEEQPYALSRGVSTLAHITFYPWQLDAFQAIRETSAVLSAPTGSGKTLVAYLWAGILDEAGTVLPPGDGRIIFTAPIKALSNERYLDLRKLGLDVGIETGDFKKNEGAGIICCTQEIYSLKYASTMRTGREPTSTAYGTPTPQRPSSSCPQPSEAPPRSYNTLKE